MSPSMGERLVSHWNRKGTCSTGWGVHYTGGEGTSSPVDVPVTTGRAANSRAGINIQGNRMSTKSNTADNQ